MDKNNGSLVKWVRKSIKTGKISFDNDTPTMDSSLMFSSEIKHYGRSIHDGAPGVGTGNWRRGGGLYPHNRDSVYKSVEAKKKKETLKEVAKKNATENLNKSFIGRLALRGSKSIARKQERRKEIAEAKKEKKQAVKEAKEVSELKKQLVKASLNDDLGKYSDEELNKAKDRLLIERQYREELAKTPEAKAMIAKQEFKQELKAAAKYAVLEGAKKGGAAVIQYQIQKAGGVKKNDNNNQQKKKNNNDQQTNSNNDSKNNSQSKSKKESENAAQRESLYAKWKRKRREKKDKK